MQEHVLGSNDQLRVQVGEKGLTVVCRSGCVWLVVDARDIVLMGSQRFRIAGGRTAYIQGLGLARVSFLRDDEVGARSQLD